jgi:hypothetical protein
MAYMKSCMFNSARFWLLDRDWTAGGKWETRVGGDTIMESSLKRGKARDWVQRQCDGVLGFLLERDREQGEQGWP